MSSVVCCMDVDALSAGEWAYLLGLYLADGSSHRVGSKWDLKFCLQGNELEIAMRVIGMFVRCGLSPRLYKSRACDMFVVRMKVANFLSVFPEKRRFYSQDGDDVLREWVSAQGLRSGRLWVPFVAGLLDGDGHCLAFWGRDRILSLRANWALCQHLLRFLPVFVGECVNGLVLGGAQVSDVRSHGFAGVKVSIVKAGREALLGSGIARWSFKVSRFLQRYEEMEKVLLDLRARFLTVNQVAARLGVGMATVRRWCDGGYLKHLRIRSRASSMAHYRLVPVEEVERLKRELKKGGG